MPSQSWDPLDQGNNHEFHLTGLRLNIKNILKSYTGYFDPFSELIQNALDAVELRRKIEPEFEPRIWVQINLRDNSLSVTDNGIGFSEEQFKNFLAPNITFKKENTRGNKGVGATYLAYGFNFLQIGTKSEDYSCIGTLKRGREWVEDNTATVIRPKVVETEQVLHEVFDSLERGSTFTLKLEGENIRPKSLSWLSVSTAEQWESILRARTPLGGIYLSTERTRTICELSVIDVNGKETESTISKCEYIYPHLYVSPQKRLTEIQDAQKRLAEDRRDASGLTANFRGLNALWDEWNQEDLKSQLRSLTAPELDLIRTHNVACYGFFCYSTQVWETVNQQKLGLSGRVFALRSGLQLATNNMPQGEQTTIYLTKNIGYQNVAQVICHFQDADPDLGRKGFQPELQQLAQRLASLIVQQFIGYRQFMKSDTGVPPNYVEDVSLEEWIEQQKEHERENRIVITRDDVFEPIKVPSITSNPVCEQDVVALFNQFLAGGIIRSVRILASSQYKQYDGIFRFCTHEPFDKYVFDKNKNPLGVDAEFAKKEITWPPKVLEYKFSFDSLIEDISKGEKSDRNIHLVVAWTLGDDWKKHYEITPLLHFEFRQHRVWHGITHLAKRLGGGDHVMHLIILDELIPYINDPDGVQGAQYESYVSQEE